MRFSTSSHPTRPRIARAGRARVALLVAAVAAVIALAFGAAGCGSSSSGNADADPAAVAPANSALYLDAVVRPQGDQRAKLLSLLDRILHTRNVGAIIRQRIDQAGRRENVSFSRDIDPWLGNRVAFYISSFRPGPAGGSPAADGAAIIAAKDTGKANDAIARLSKNARQASYQGVDYRQTGDTDVGVVGNYVVAGTPAAFRRVVDVSKGSAQALSDAAAFKRSRGLIASGGLGDLYVRPGALLSSVIAARGGNSSSAALMGPVLGPLQSTSVAAALRALGNGFELDGVSSGNQSVSAPRGNASAVLQAVPADAWAAVGIGAIGAHAQALLQRLAGQGVGGVPLDTLLREARAQTGIDIPHDLLSWMGDGAVFVRGTSRSSLGGAAVIESSNPGLTRLAISKIGALLRKSHGANRVGALRVPGAQGVAVRSAGGHEVDLALAGTRFVLAYGRPALVDVLQSSGRSTLGTSPRFRTAASSLGDLRPTIFVDMHGVTQLVSAIGGSSPRVQQALPYLRSFTSVIAGGASQGGVSRFRVIVGVG